MLCFRSMNMKKYFYLKNNISTRGITIPLNSVGITDKFGNMYLIKNRIKINLDENDVQFFDISKTGDEYDYKVCDRCFKFLPTTFFPNNRIKKHSIKKRPSCKDCRKIKDGISVSSQQRQIWDSKKPKNYDLFECPICKKISIAGISKIVLDHNHQNGKVRGYLCESCNTGIGRFDDKPEIIENAKKWLLKST